jgi:hypothetical protein
MMVRRFAVLLAAVLVALGVPAASAGARPDPGPSCGPTGVLIQTPGTIKLRHDLQCSVVLDLPRDQPEGLVTIDLAGHEISEVDIHDHAEAALLHGTIGRVGGDNRSTLTLRRVHVRSTLKFFELSPLAVDIHNSTIDGDIFADNGGLIDRSRISGGIFESDSVAGGDITITNNVIGGGISLGADFQVPDIGGLIENNTIRGAAGPGIAVGDVRSLRPLFIHHNRISDNTGDGIAISGVLNCGGSNCPPGYGLTAGPVTVRGNRVIGNGGHGINVTLNGASPTLVVDGGNNHASGNSTDPQCVGIICQL